MFVFCYLANANFIRNTEGETAEWDVLPSEAEEGARELGEGLTVIVSTDEDHSLESSCQSRRPLPNP